MQRKGSTMTSIALIIGVLVVFGVMLGLTYVGINNSLISKDLDVQMRWGEIQNQYQRRYDLIPRVYNSTMIYLEYEESLLIQVTEARSRWQDSLNNGNQEEQMEAMQEFDQAANRFMSMMVTVEAYPDLKGSQVVMSLIDELEGTENRIAVARGRYITSVNDYNRAIRVWPNSIVADMQGYLPRPTFTAAPGAETAPNIPR